MRRGRGGHFWFIDKLEAPRQYWQIVDVADSHLHVDLFLVQPWREKPFPFNNRRLSEGAGKDLIVTMDRALSYLFLVIALALANDVFRRTCLPYKQEEDMIARWLAWCVVFASIFLGCFYALGLVELATSLHVVSPGYACVLLLLTYAVVLAWRRRARSAALFNVRDTNISSGKLRLPPLPRMVRAALLATVLVFLITGLMLLPGFPRGYEPQAYHLPLALNFLEMHSLKVWDSSYMHTFPANASLYYGFLLGCISEHLVSASDLIFLLPLGLAVFGIGRTAGADVTTAMLASLGMLTIPIVAFSALECGADVGGTAFLAIAVYFVTRSSRSETLDQIISGLAAGLAFGFKSLHLISICYLCLLLIFRACRNEQGTIQAIAPWRAIRSLLVFLGGVMSTSAFWLIRNYAQLHNPLYPVSLPFFKYLGWSAAPDIDYSNRIATQFEWVRSSTEWFAYPWLEWHRAGENFKHSSGLGPFFAAFIPVACLMALVALVQRSTPNRQVLGMLLGGGSFVLVVWWLLGDRQPRYFMGALVFLFPLAAWMLSLPRGKARQLVEVTACICVYYMGFVILSTQTVEFGARFVYNKEFTRHEFYSYPPEIDRLPPGSTLMNVGARTFNYALFGETHRNHVISYTESLADIGLSRTDLDQRPPLGGTLHSSLIKRMGVNYLFTMGSPELKVDDCITMQKADEIPADAGPQKLPLDLYVLKGC